MPRKAIAEKVNAAHTSETMERPSYIKPKKETVKEVEVDDSIAQAAIDVIRLKEEKSSIEKSLENQNALIKDAEQKLIERIEAMGVEQIKVASVGTFWVKPENHPSVKQENYEAFLAWLDKNKLGSMARRYVHPQTLKSWVTDMLKEGKSLPNMVNNFQQSKLHHRKAK